MASVASLLMLLAVAFPIIQSISCNHSAQATFPHETPAQEPFDDNDDPDVLCNRDESRQCITLSIYFCKITANTNELIDKVFPSLPQNYRNGCLKEMVHIAQTCCPPLGSLEDRFNVTVLGTSSPAIVGSAYMKVYRQQEPPGFNLWLADLDPELEDIDLGNITHAVFYCFSNRRFIDEDKNIKGFYMTLMEPFKKWPGQSKFYCALYSIIKENPRTILMVISANNSCDGLATTMANIEQLKVPEGHRTFEDGSTALLLTMNIP